MNNIEKELFHLCTCFLKLLELAREKGIVSHEEHEFHSQLKKSFIEERKNKERKNELSS